MKWERQRRKEKGQGLKVNQGERQGPEKVADMGPSLSPHRPQLRAWEPPDGSWGLRLLSGHRVSPTREVACRQLVSQLN